MTSPGSPGVFDADAFDEDQFASVTQPVASPVAVPAESNRFTEYEDDYSEWAGRSELVPVPSADADLYYDGDDAYAGEYVADGGFDYPQGTDVETMLVRLADIIRQARPMPLSASAMINKDEVIDMIEEVLGRLPEELRAARWMLKERDEYLARMERDGEDILATARARSEQLVQKQEVVRAANSRARQIEMRANEDARRLRLEAEDYCDQKLGSFEIVLERTMKSVRAGRQKLQAPHHAPAEVIELDTDPVIEHSDFFDQDR